MKRVPPILDDSYVALPQVQDLVPVHEKQRQGRNQEKMASWNSVPLEVIYQVLGWVTFFSWSICSYPQIILNFRRKSVVGLNFDYEILNLTKHSSYLIYNASLYFSSTVQKQYFGKYGYGEMIPVAANDVAFSTHALVMVLILLTQIAIFERGTQKFSKYAIGIVSVVWLFAAICFFIALHSCSWLWLISIFNSIQVCMTLIKYFPQVLMNFLRKSTDGFSIESILLDFSGGVFNYSQMAVQSIDQGSWVNFYGNMGKLLISLVTIFYDSVLMLQHYVLYRGKKKKAFTSSEGTDKIQEPLISSTDHQIKHVIVIESSARPPQEQV